jgi:O-antigen/teichoic acid export membrane protein
LLSHQFIHLKQRITASYKRLRSTNILSNFLNLSSIQISNILLLLIITRLVTGNVGIEVFGLVMFAYRFSTLAGTIVNYGTGQSGVKDVAFHLSDTPVLSSIFINTLSLRLIIFVLFLIGMAGYYFLPGEGYNFLLLALPIVLAEVLNPLCFFIGIERIKVFNIANLVSNIIAAIAIFLFIKTPADAPWVNLILGMGNVLTYIYLLIYLTNRLNLSFSAPKKADLVAIGKANFYLTVNNISANLQQSVITFALAGMQSSLLGPYSLADRFIGQCRNLLNTVTNAVYPNAVNLYKQGAVAWDAYRKKSKYLFAALFLVAAITVFIAADLIIFILSKQHNADAILILRIMAFVPVISALNVFSVLDMLLKNKNVYLFRVAIALTCIAALVAFGAASWGNKWLIGGFTFIVELCGWAMYEYIITKPTVNNG